MADARFAGIGMTSARTRDRLVQRLREQGITNLAVLDRIRNVPRHIFVDEALGSRAYEDTALPIGFGQTISQPYIVARMTEALARGRRGRQGARSRHRVRLSDRGARAARGARSTPSSASSRCRRARSSAERARHQERELQARRRHPGLESARAVRRRSSSPPRRSRCPKRCSSSCESAAGCIVPVGPEGEQELIRFTRREQQIDREVARPGGIRAAARRHGLKLRNRAL